MALKLGVGSFFSLWAKQILTSLAATALCQHTGSCIFAQHGLCRASPSSRVQILEISPPWPCCLHHTEVLTIKHKLFKGQYENKAMEVKITNPRSASCLELLFLWGQGCPWDCGHHLGSFSSTVTPGSAFFSVKAWTQSDPCSSYTAHGV